MLACHCWNCGKLFASVLPEDGLRCEECSSANVEVLARPETQEPAGDHASNDPAL